MTLIVYLLGIEIDFILYYFFARLRKFGMNLENFVFLNGITIVVSLNY